MGVVLHAVLAEVEEQQFDAGMRLRLFSVERLVIASARPLIKDRVVVALTSGVQTLKGNLIQHFPTSKVV